MNIDLLRGIANRQIQNNGQVSLAEVRRRYRNVTQTELSLDAIASVLGPEFEINGQEIRLQ